mmetsp:Transcript_14841/g.39431  ORF Transcript_14841/g.39431 Transcript_14841/m.39431 type:complete len:805 (-) Transcript_14841:108-2522(-)
MTDSAGSKVRLIFTDSSLDGGQRVKAINEKPMSMEMVLGLLGDHFGFQDFMKQKGLQKKDLLNGGLHVVGVDGARRIPIQHDPEFAAFFNSPLSTALPSIEVQLARKPYPTRPTTADRKSGRAPRDRTELLEDDNAKLVAANQHTTRRMDELERQILVVKQQSQLDIQSALLKMSQTQADALKLMHDQVDSIKHANSNVMADMDVVRKHVAKVEEKQKKDHDVLAKLQEKLHDDTEEQFQGVGLKLHELQALCDEMRAEYRAEDVRQMKIIDDHVQFATDKMDNLDKTKVDKTWLDAHHEQQDTSSGAYKEQVDKEFAGLAALLKEAETQLRKEQHEASDVHLAACKKLTEADESLGEAIKKNKTEAADVSAKNRAEAADVSATNKAELEAEAKKNLTHLEDEVKRIEGTISNYTQGVMAEVDTRCKEALSKADSVGKVVSDDCQGKLDTIYREFREKDKNVNTKYDELTIKSEKTFTAINERLEEMVRIERARFSSLESDFTQNVARIQTDLRAEVERLRDDHDQEAARLDADLGDLHMKHDVTKQEINFFQSRLQEQREWAQGQLLETTMAVKAAQADAQEGLAAATKMLHALRDDAVSFREKMAKYISLLQHSSDSHGDALQGLETQRGRMRTQLDVLVSDHKAYTADMDGWADDVRVKVERIFRALEPPRVEWRICRASQRAKEMKRPLAVKSPTFTLKGLRQVQMEFFPDGHNNAPEGKAVLRMFFPPNAHMRFQCWVGRTSLGAYEYKPGGGLSLDVMVDDWKDQITDDGSIGLIVEVLQDFNSDDESLAREVRVESP